MKQLLFLLLVATSATTAFAASDPNAGIPWGTIGQQVLNLTIVIGGLSLLLRRKVSAHFKKRQSQFAQLVEKAEQAKMAAEKNKREITERLQKLESTADDGLKNAKSEAEDLKRKILSEAQTLSTHLEEEAKRTAEYEIERVKLQLRKALLEEAVQVAKDNLQNQVGPTEQKRLQSEFIGKIQVVQ
jgi:F-type H+-transporting ATPase subunit b